MKKKILIIVGSIILAFAILIGYFVVQDFKQEDLLKEELDSISEIAYDYSKHDEIEKMLNRTVTKDDYKKVEKAYKKYITDIYNNIIDINNVINDEELTKALTVENYKNDGPSFIITKSYLNKAMKDLEEYKNKYYEYLTEEKAMSYLNTKDLDNYYVDFYKNEIVGDIETEKNDTTVKESIESIISLLNASYNVIDYLSNNKDSWTIENDTILFDTEKDLNEYNELLAKVIEN